MLHPLNPQARTIGSLMLCTAVHLVMIAELILDALHFLHTREISAYSFFPFIVSRQLALP